MSIKLIAKALENQIAQLINKTEAKLAIDQKKAFIITNVDVVRGDDNDLTDIKVKYKEG